MSRQLQQRLGQLEQERARVRSRPSVGSGRRSPPASTATRCSRSRCGPRWMRPRQAAAGCSPAVGYADPLVEATHLGPVSAVRGPAGRR